MTDDTDQDTGEEIADGAADATDDAQPDEDAAGGDEEGSGADDEDGGGEDGGGGGDEGRSQDERLDKLGEQIGQARTRARETIGEPEEKFYESGDAESESDDDQTIAPPG